MPTDWATLLAEELKKPYVAELKEFLKDEKGEVYPLPEDVFRAMRLTPYEKVRVVIMGQDPYHGPQQAHGLSFSVQRGVKIPPSLKNIYKELESDLGVMPAPHGDLSAWAKQGVLLLNATLTVRRGEPKSHYGKGWELFTDKIIEVLSRREDPLVFILWGQSAKEKVAKFLAGKNHPHLVLTSSHPSPYSVEGFFGTKPFSKTNAFLVSHGMAPIEWSLAS
ncbi:MAG: uracil-DNA glycosylase [Chlamydiae bacterium RIFCSPHIGHO2_12_FULL_49_11]|nr:MAG: uracil-DNA glycosylase [Chlamydiae bacterium RIFCSPHIGHO2_12_FULL_49_11]